MKTIDLLLRLLSLSLIATISYAQGTFQDLDFEAASLVSIPGSPPRVQFDPAFPGWTASIGTNPASQALYNTVNLDTSGISIIDQGWTNSFGGVIEGTYTAVLQAGVIGSIANIANVSLSQTGLVPATAKSLRFSAYFLTLNSPQFALVVSLGDQNLSFTPLFTAANYTEYGADIGSWAGQNTNLTFTAVAENPHRNNEYVFLDSIEFSDIAVPEPGTTALLGLGALLIGWRALKRKS